MVEGSGVPDPVGVGNGCTVADSVGLGEGCGVVGVVGICDGTVVLGDGLVVLGDGLAVLGDGLAVVVLGFVVVLPGFVVVLLGADDGCPAVDDGTDHGGVGEFGVAEGCVVGNHAARGVERFRAGTPGRCPDRVTPHVRSTFGSRDVVLPKESVLCGGCVLAESCPPNGTKNRDPAAVTATAATALTFRTGRRPRLCRGPDFRRCRPRL